MKGKRDSVGVGSIFKVLGPTDDEPNVERARLSHARLTRFRKRRNDDHFFRRLRPYTTFCLHIYYYLMKHPLDAVLAMAIALCCNPSCETPSTASLLATAGSSWGGGSSNKKAGGVTIDDSSSADIGGAVAGGPFRSNSIVHQPRRRASGRGDEACAPASATGTS
jgi:hypothetical protein